MRSVTGNLFASEAGITVPSLGLRVGGADFHAPGCAPRMKYCRESRFLEGEDRETGSFSLDAAQQQQKPRRPQRLLSTISSKPLRSSWLSSCLVPPDGQSILPTMFSTPRAGLATVLVRPCAGMRWGAESGSEGDAVNCGVVGHEYRGAETREDTSH
jgi:hypothetical protein